MCKLAFLIFIISTKPIGVIQPWKLEPHLSLTKFFHAIARHKDQVLITILTCKFAQPKHWMTYSTYLRRQGILVSSSLCLAFTYQIIVLILKLLNTQCASFKFIRVKWMCDCSTSNTVPDLVHCVINLNNFNCAVQEIIRSFNSNLPRLLVFRVSSSFHWCMELFWAAYTFQAQFYAVILSYLCYFQCSIYS